MAEPVPDGSVMVRNDYVLFDSQIVRVGRIYDQHETCPNLDTSDTTLQKAHDGKLKIISEAFVDVGSTYSYVYWVSYDDGPQVIYQANLTMNHCTIHETQRNAMSFYGESRWNAANAAYTDLLRRALAGQ